MRVTQLGGDEFRLLWECDWQRPVVGPPGAPGGRGYVPGKKVDVQLRTFWVVLAEIATSEGKIAFIIARREVM